MKPGFSVELDLEKTKAAWERYIDGGEELPSQLDGVRPEILDSWRRSKHPESKMGLPLQLGPDDLKKAWEENGSLLRIAYPYLQDFHHYLQGMEHQFLLSDSRGYLLKCISDDESLRELSKQTHVVEGRLLTESVSGTNGISFCLASGKTVLVVGPEHYLPEFHIFVCVASPIFDPSHRLIGCLSIMGSLETYHPSMMAMLRAAVTGIERELCLFQNNRFLSTMLDSFKSAVLLLDQKGMVLRGNHLASSFFRREEGLEGCFLDQLVQADSLPSFLCSLDREADAVECTLFLQNETALDVSVTLRVLGENSGETEGTLLILDQQDELHRITNRLSGNYANLTFDSLVTASPAMEAVKSIGTLAADSDCPVLIFGEQGTGKASLAQAIHQAGSRREKPFLSLTCQTLNKEQLRRELFGFEGGMGEGKEHLGIPGKLELAGDGTVFLEEPAALPMELQRELYQALQKKEIVRIGGKAAKTIRARVIASTSTDLLAAVQNGSFLGELYYLFHMFSIILPPLCQRQEDILLIAENQLNELCRIFGKEVNGFSPECQQAISEYPWPGNIPQLEKVMEQAMNRAEGKILALHDLPEELVRNYLAKAETQMLSAEEPPPPQSPASGSTDDLEYNRILLVLRQERGNMKTAAQMLGIPLSSLYRKVKKYEIDIKEQRVRK